MLALWFGDAAEAQCLETILYPVGLPADAGFGATVVASEDTLAVGAVLDDGTQPQTGAVYVYDLGQNAPIFRQRIISPSGQTGDEFGRAIAIHGDVMAIGAPNHGSGRVFVFERVDGDWTYRRKLVPSTVDVAFGFGSSVVTDGEYIVGGAPHDSEFAHAAGAVYVFRRRGEDWLLVTKLVRRDSDVLDRFGRTIELGRHGVLAVANAPDLDGRYASIAIYQIGDKTITATAVIDAPWRDDDHNEHFAIAMSLSDDFLLVGDPSVMGRGAVYVYRDHATHDWRLVHTQTAPDTQSQFGASLGFTKSRAYVGDPAAHSFLHAESGVIYEYDWADEWQLLRQYIAGAQPLGLGTRKRMAATSSRLYASSLAPHGDVHVFREAACAGCSGDLDSDDIVGVADLLQLLGRWGQDVRGPQDLDGDGVIEQGDLLEVLLSWGECD